MQHGRNDSVGVLQRKGEDDRRMLNGVCEVFVG